MTAPRWVGLCVLCAALGAAAGYFGKPAKVTVKDNVVIQTVTEFREVAAKRTEKGPVTATKRTVTEILPGGGRITTTDLVLTRGPVVTLESRAVEGRKAESREESHERVEEARAWWALEAGVAVDLSNPLAVPSQWWAQASMRVLGPFWLGAGVLKSDEYRLAISGRIEFP